MGVPGFIFGVVLFILIQLSAGQLSLKEDLKTLKECDINNINFNCSNNDEIIAVQSIEFWYSPECEMVCCEYNSSHTKQDPSSDDIQKVNRMCSGKQSCSLNLDGVRDFGSFGYEVPVYVLILFHCIPRARRTSICSSDVELMSNGLPLYLTSKNYPDVAAGDSTCSCLFSSCSSNIILYVIDVDLYLDPGNCEQIIQVMNGTNTALHEMNCESYYDRNDITVTNLNSRYVKINSIDNSTQNQEGYFFLGFAASDQNASFTLTCQDESASSMCIDCGNVPRIANGMVTLIDSQNTKYGALANVTCSEGFESDSNNITCLVSGQWSQSLCTSKDCGSIARLDNGQITLASENVTSVGAIANVACDIGYNASTFSIRCQSSGLWDTVRCTIIDCGNPYHIEYGSVTLLKTSTTMYSSLARVTCQEGYKTRKQVITCKETGAWEISSCEPEDDDRLTLFVLVAILSTLLMVVTILFGFYVFWRYRKRQRTRGSPKEVNTYAEVNRQSQQPRYSDIALENTM